MRRLTIALALLPLAAAWADTPPPAKAVVPPPPAVSEDKGPAQAEPEVTVTQQGDKKVEEFRLNGHVYMLKVTPANGKPYFLMDEDGKGQMHQIDPATRVRTPQWVLLNF